jgi:hypothetical protein
MQVFKKTSERSRSAIFIQVFKLPTVESSCKTRMYNNKSRARDYPKNVYLGFYNFKTIWRNSLRLICCKHFFARGNWLIIRIFLK